jgi:CBS domain-containing protein
MKVSEAMTRDVRTVAPEHSIQEAARIMSELDAGIVPVGKPDRLIGMITDRDIAVRAVAQGKGPQTPVREIMTDEVTCCFEDDDTDEVARLMSDQQLRRLPVVDRNKRMVGIISLADLVITDNEERAGEAIAGISQPGGQHSQAGERR